jgi:putative oxidoreductase
MKYFDLGALVLRLTFGGLMLPHGIKKLDKFENGFSAVDFPDPIGLGPGVALLLTLFSELVCAGAIVLGIKPRIFTIPLIITMLLAAFVVHGDDPFAKKEKALLFFGGYLAILLMGGGRYSIKN